MRVDQHYRAKGWCRIKRIGSRTAPTLHFQNRVVDGIYHKNGDNLGNFQSFSLLFASDYSLISVLSGINNRNCKFAMVES